jgi:hypothetical protein
MGFRIVATDLPGAFDPECAQGCAFALGKGVLDDTVDAAAAWAFAERCAQLVQIFGFAGGYDFDVAVFGIANPAFEFELAGFAVNEPAEADALDASADEEVKDHESQFGR